MDRFSVSLSANRNNMLRRVLRIRLAQSTGQAEYRAMRFVVFASIAGIIGCGGGSSSLLGMDANAGDATPDMPVDAVPGTLFADPPDPVGSPCAGVRGFPGLPMLVAGNGATSLRVADVSGDGTADVVYITNVQIVIAKGVGNGTFATPSYITTPWYAYSLRLADVDGNSSLDLVFGSSQQKLIDVALNNGDGTFAAAQGYDTGIYVNDLAVADVNADGKQDLLALNAQSGTIAVLLKATTGFGTATSYSTGSSIAEQLAVADLTGDGRPEVVATTLQGVSVLFNSTTGLGAATTYTLASVGEGIAIGDLNADGKPDVLVGTDGGSRPGVSVLMNQGGTIATPVVYLTDSILGAAPRSLALGDVDGDGKLDVVVGDTNDEQLNVLRGAGDGSLGTATSFYTGHVMNVALSDLDGDTHLDLVVGGYRGVRPYLNTNTSSLFRMLARVKLVGTAGVRSVGLEDVNGDSRADLIVDDEGGSAANPPLFGVVLATSAGTLTNPLSALPLSQASPTFLAADLNNDGQRDFVLVGGSVRGVIANGTGGLALAPPLMPSAYPAHVAAADFNNDAIRDVVFGDTFANTVSFARGLGDGTFAPPVQIMSAAVRGIAAGDLDKNGTMDVVIDSLGAGDQTDVLLGLGNGTFGAPQHTTLTVAADLLALRDMNGDTKLDLIRYGNSLSIALGDGAGGFAPPVASSMALSPATTFGDVNGDGALDLLSMRASVLLVELGNGDGTVTAPVFYDATAFGWSLAVADLDGDGQLDVVTDGDPTHVHVLYGHCSN
jgi:hypothetical protein